MREVYAFWRRLKCHLRSKDKQNADASLTLSWNKDFPNVISCEAFIKTADVLCFKISLD